MNPGFVHLNLHSEFSLVDGIARIRSLVERTKALGMPAVAITDRANVFCMVRFYRAAVAAGIKPIVGVDMPIGCGSNNDPAGVLTLLAMDVFGYRQLARLLTRCYMAERSTGVPVAARDWVSECAGGIIAISPGPAGDVGQALLHGRAGEAERRAAMWRPCSRNASTSVSRERDARRMRRAWSRRSTSRSRWGSRSWPATT